VLLEQLVAEQLGLQPAAVQHVAGQPEQQLD
jgi:hypothetical protein